MMMIVLIVDSISFIITAIMIFVIFLKIVMAGQKFRPCFYLWRLDLTATAGGMRRRCVKGQECSVFFNFSSTVFSPDCSGHTNLSLIVFVFRFGL